MNKWLDLHAEKRKFYKIGDFVYLRKSKFIKTWNTLIFKYGPEAMLIKRIFWTFVDGEYTLMLLLETFHKKNIFMKRDDVCLVDADFIAF